MPEKWALLREKYGSLHGELGFSQEPAMVNLATLDVEELKHLKAEAEAAKERNRIDEIMNFRFKIIGEFSSRGTITLPIASLFQHTEKAKTAIVRILRNEIEERTREIEETKEFVEVLNNAVLNPETKRLAAKGVYRIRIKYEIKGRRSTTTKIRSPQYESLAALTEEKITCLKEATKFHQKVIGTYRTELRKREAQKNKIPMMIKQAETLCKKAIKCMEKIRKVNDEVIKTDKAPDFKDAKTFIEKCEEFKKAERQYYSLKQQLQFITDEKIKFPQFPGDLNSDYTSKRHLIEDSYKREKQQLTARR